MAFGGGVLLVIVAVLVARPSLFRSFSGVVGPALVLPWMILCACAWFHPAQGSLSPRAPQLARLPVWLQQVLRWYAALFLDALVLVGAIACPLSRWAAA